MTEHDPSRPEQDSDFSSDLSGIPGLEGTQPPAPQDPPPVEPPAEPPSESDEPSLGSFGVSTPPRGETVAEPEGPSITLEPPSSASIDEIRRFSEETVHPRPVVPAAYPFSLLIEGPLDVYEKDKLLDLLARENMGIRDIDLEPQLSAGRILIPRISEYAGILLIQALRGTTARMRLAPSDEIFATDETREERPSVEAASREEILTPSGHMHPAEQIRITPSAGLPDLKDYTVIDVLTASASLRSETVEAERSNQYQEVLESLQRELRYKAHRRGATAILNYKAELKSLDLPTRYRLTLTGDAVKAHDGPDELGLPLT
ncbi:MAG: hypothetical protein NDJ90_07090 [Oligoflexia bacterium]|nr:hypothetical protein [Oligoflexia bacterium]